MGVIHGAGFKNDSCDEYAIDVVFRLAERRWKAYQKNQEEMAAMPFACRLFPFVANFFLYLRFLSSARNLVASLKISSFTTDPLFPILVGEFLYKIERFEKAATCFGRAVEILNVPNQDIRLRALMGMLECKMAITKKLLNAGDPNLKDSNGMEDLCRLIIEDLDAASLETQMNINSRMSGSFRLDMAILAIKAQARMESFIFGKLNRLP